jgi:hypothetical protein
MSENLDRLRPAADLEFERDDLKPRGVYAFLSALALVAGLVALLLWGLRGFMDSYDKAHQGPQSPLAPAPANAEARRAVPFGPTSEAIKQTFPLPRLEQNERTELGAFRTGEEERLHSYGFVDEKAGVVHIPIERAMKLVVERGLPVRPAAAAASQEAATEATSPE